MKISIETMRPEEIPAVSAVLGKAYAGTPMVMNAFGANPYRFEVMIRNTLDRFPGQVSVAKDDGLIVGVVRYVIWPECKVSLLRTLLMLPKMLKEIRGSALKRLTWFSLWAKHDPKQPHWHFGPFGVLPDRQRQGIGTQLLTHFCEHVDHLGAASYLETDKPENVRLYQRFGFLVIEDAVVIGVPNWFMWRSPQPRR